MQARPGATGGAVKAKHGLVLAGAAVVSLVTVAAMAEDVRAKETAIEKVLVAKLGDDAAAIRVTLVRDKAILTGDVKQRAVEELSEEVALSVPGVEKVDSEVSSESTAKIGKGKLVQEADDAELEASVQKALKSEIGKHTKTIEIEACDGWVSLRGTSPDTARHDISLATAAKVEGVKKVIDLLVVRTK
jgi:osmotically-inducible protein OsmY